MTNEEKLVQFFQTEIFKHIQSVSEKDEIKGTTSTKMLVGALSYALLDAAALVLKSAGFTEENIAKFMEDYAMWERKISKERPVVGN